MKNLALPVAVATLLTCSAASLAETNIAVIDVARVFEEYAMTHDLETRFEDSRREMSSRAEEKRTRIEQMRRSLKAFDPASDDFANREQEVMRAEMEYQFWTAQRERELKGEHKRWLMKVYRNTQSTIAVVAERRDISLVLTYDRLADDAPDSMALRQQILLQKVIYHDARVDITDEVLELLNAAYQNEGGLRSVNLPAGRMTLPGRRDDSAARNP